MARPEASSGSGAQGREGRGVEVVALVASAGGLEALSGVLRVLPGDFPAAVVVAQHLGGLGSVLVDILTRRITLPVGWAREGGRIEPGTVTVCPPRSVLEVLPDGTCALRPAENVQTDRPLDALLTSIGDSFAGASLAVVLTGMGSDGASGAAAVHAAGGRVIAQSEETAERPAMPAAAVAAGAVDLVLPLYDIGPALVDAALGRRLPLASDEAQAIRATFGDKGVMAGQAAQLDWSRTPLGLVSSWSPTLRSVVRLMMGSPEPTFVFWGDDMLWLSNDASLQVMPGREGSLLGRPYAEVVPEVSAETRPEYQRVLDGEAQQNPWVSHLYMRDGRMQRVWVYGTNMPIWEPDGTVGGIHRVIHERTDEVLAARRLSTLDALAQAPRAGSRREALSEAVEVLGDAADVVFAVAYLLDPSATRAGLVAATGVVAGGALAPRELRLVPGAAWPLHEASEPVVVDDLPSRFPGHRVGTDQVTPGAAVVHPLRDDAEEQVVGMLILGVDPYLNFDARYREFLMLVGNSVEGRMADAQARHRERRRLERLAELDRAKTEFFSNVSHEFRTPLTLMLGPLDELGSAGGGLSPQQRADVDLVRRNARRLLRLVATMLDFSQIEAGRLRATFAPVDLAERTREVVAQFDSAVKRAGLALRVDLSALPAPVWVDVEMWEKIVSNLLSNALKFTFFGEIEVSLRARPHHAELVVRDTGVGIPEEELPHVFKRFHRVRDSRARTHEGAGIGLALVDELVRRHHGRVRVTSTVGEGTAFTVWIPTGRRPELSEAPPEVPASTEVAAAMAEEATRWGEAPETELFADDGGARHPLGGYAPAARVLVADDSSDMRDYLARLLAPHWQLEMASDGAQALALARADPPDLVLADVMMPGLDGFALLRALREDAELRAVPVVLVTARAGEESAIEGLLAGADDYIVKPFSARELVARVAGQLDLARVRRRAAELNVFRIGLSDALRALGDPLEIQQTACRMLVEQLGADRARFVEVDQAAGELITMGGYAVDGMPGGFGRYPLEDYRPLAQAVLAGRRLVIEDTQTDPYVAGISPALAEAQIGAQLVLPLVRGQGSTVALAVHQRTARSWTPEEVAIAEEAAGRAWAEVERARAETALRDSEERMRLAIRATGMVTWEWIPAEDRIITSDSFADVYGLPALAGAEQGFALVLPEDATRHLDKVRAIATEGGAYRSRFRIRRPDNNQIVWLEERAEAKTGPDGTVERVIGVTLDITAPQHPE
ncbi:hypothetical protein GCM10010168_47300 [Actinoplanes ianthinogenes]|uniref:histidine kinase n=1 Tax=Actinoplanes ianthinogenes TaxID=122358 RepID=A0ABM7LNY9_9ACTN|nr:chemotaxis protein CheB [Actinoplanes ianthinogenes]BCJ40971.1 hypothetical protein Aiant_16280 [Actinoplanes ianthinogenes]GGR23839.1 hypothetical protein GCM10010168_47300 [Actinoplanes ianthinogenes]